MKIEILPDYNAVSRRAAHLIANVVLQKPDAVLCLASGHTPIGLFKELVLMGQQQALDLSRCHFIGLDEWVGIASEAVGSCRYFLDEHLIRPLGLEDGQLFFFDGLANDLEAECRKMDHNIAQLGGLDVMLVGIGMNGHIALNEPGTPWGLHSHVSTLDQTTVTVGQKYFDQTTLLQKGLTLGLQHLREVRLPLLMATGTAKAPIVHLALEGNISESVPASIFQVLDHGVVLLDEEAGSLLG